MNSRRSKLALVAAGVGGAAVAGFGLAFGRDIYKKSKKNAGLIVLLLVVVSCPFIGGRGFVRGHDRGLFGTIFLTVLGSLLLIAAGLCAATFLVLEFLLISDNGKLENPFPFALLGGSAVTAIVAGVGVVVGLVQRQKRLKAITVGKFNERFLEENGFRETDGDDITHYDDSGQALRFLEAHQNRLVFMAVGRRGKRAFIDLDQDGRMVSYSGVK
ncbi:MAG: hypothetical protein E5V75_04925 [Mesorhizobium sp.]|nr:MAG: hypothetical protein E5V75_04925 [Mesorhizobium sp.]